MTEEEAAYELTILEPVFASLTPDERRQFENELYLRAYVRGWTGDPLLQPAATVVSAIRAVLAKRKQQGARTHSSVRHELGACGKTYGSIRGKTVVQVINNNESSPATGNS